MAKKYASRFLEVCPRRIKCPPNQPCPSALLRIEFIQAGKREGAELPGCPYYVNDVLSNYCWFNYSTQKNFGSHTTKEISQALSLTPAQVEKAERGGIEKILKDQSPEALAELKEYLADLNQGNLDDTIYAIGSFSTEVIEELGQLFANSHGGEIDPSEERKKPK